MHLAVSVFRAVENRVPLARAVNTGISAVIDGNGRVLAALPKLQEGDPRPDHPARRPHQPLFVLGRLARHPLPGGDPASAPLGHGTGNSAAQACRVNRPKTPSEVEPPD